MATIHSSTTRGHLVWLLCVVALCFASVAQGATFDVPQADVAMLVVAETGQVLYEKGADTPLPPASLAKMMTMLLTMEALERGELRWDEPVRVSRKASSIHGSKVWLAEGDRLTVEQLLWAVSIQSANDASIALAERVAGTEEAFVARMNQKAQLLGMTDSHFSNSHGLPDATVDGKATLMSARDASILGRELVVNHPVVLEWTSQWNKPLGPGTRNPIVLENTNRLVLNRSLGVDGLKTGHTSEAGYQLVATAEENGLRLISVVMATDTADERYNATERLLRYGFTAFERLTIGEGERPFMVRIPGAVEEVAIRPEQPMNILALKNGVVDIRTEVVLDGSVQAPVEAGQVVGEVVVWIDDHIAGRAAALNVDDVARAGFFRRQWMNFTDWVSDLIQGDN